LLGSTLIFIAIEKLLPLRKGQAVFRPEWQTDLKHFAVNHFLVGLILFTVNFVIHHGFGWMVQHDFQLGGAAASGSCRNCCCAFWWPISSQYWTHRAYHEIPFLWKFHAVHHSAKSDGLAGRFAPACSGGDCHPRAGDDAAVRGRFQRGGGQRLHHHCRLPGPCSTTPTSAFPGDHSST
jgi:sterol desaturase/sphingolipid hydroxylase (fatty acid hydroxylase superfamily)